MKAPQLALVLTGVLLNAIAQLLLKAGAGSLADVELRASNAPGDRRQAGVQRADHCRFAAATRSASWCGSWRWPRVEVSVAYPMLSVGYVVNALAAWWLFNENLSGTRIAGIGVILVGVWLVARSSSGT